MVKQAVSIKVGCKTYNVSNSWNSLFLCRKEELRTLTAFSVFEQLRADKYKDAVEVKLLSNDPGEAEDVDEPVANITYSLCWDDPFSHLQVSVHELSAYDGAVVCTDGMINPYQNLSTFSTGVVAPAIATLDSGNVKSLEGFVSQVGTRLGTDDDVSLGIVVKDKLSSRIYKHTKTI